ncbi:MAG: patatin-like phospholipase family protein [Bryobacteraceae bacterium]
MKRFVPGMFPHRVWIALTELRNMRTKLVRWPDMTWHHIAASCAVPLFLRHHHLGGVTYTDGGLLDPLPLWAALEMGATHIVSVNALKHRPAALRAIIQAARRFGGYHPPSSEGTFLVQIEPSRTLGSAKDAMYWTRANADRWIELGRADAIASKHLVVECLDRAQLSMKWEDRQVCPSTVSFE